MTRLGFSRSKVKATEVQGKEKNFSNRATDAECCYIRLHERGPEAQMVHAFLSGFGKTKAKEDRTPCGHTSSIFD